MTCEECDHLKQLDDTRQKNFNKLKARIIQGDELLSMCKATTTKNQKLLAEINVKDVQLRESRNEIEKLNVALREAKQASAPSAPLVDPNTLAELNATKVKLQSANSLIRQLKAQNRELQAKFEDLNGADKKKDKLTKDLSRATKAAADAKSQQKAAMKKLKEQKQLNLAAVAQGEALIKHLTQAHEKMALLQEEVNALREGRKNGLDEDENEDEDTPESPVVPAAPGSGSCKKRKRAVSNGRKAKPKAAKKGNGSQSTKKQPTPTRSKPKPTRSKSKELEESQDMMEAELGAQLEAELEAGLEDLDDLEGLGEEDLDPDDLGDQGEEVERRNGLSGSGPSVKVDEEKDGSMESKDENEVKTTLSFDGLDTDTWNEPKPPKPKRRLSSSSMSSGSSIDDSDLEMNYSPFFGSLAQPQPAVPPPDRSISLSSSSTSADETEHDDAQDHLSLMTHHKTMGISPLITPNEEPVAEVSPLVGPRSIPSALDSSSLGPLSPTKHDSPSVHIPVRSTKLRARSSTRNLELDAFGLRDEDDTPDAPRHAPKAITGKNPGKTPRNSISPKGIPEKQPLENSKDTQVEVKGTSLKKPTKQITARKPHTAKQPKQPKQQISLKVLTDPQGPPKKSPPSTSQKQKQQPRSSKSQQPKPKSLSSRNSPAKCAQLTSRAAYSMWKSCLRHIVTDDQADKTCQQHTTVSERVGCVLEKLYRLADPCGSPVQIQQLAKTLMDLLLEDAHFSSTDGTDGTEGTEGTEDMQDTECVDPIRCERWEKVHGCVLVLRQLSLLLHPTYDSTLANESGLDDRDDRNREDLQGSLVDVFIRDCMRRLPANRREDRGAMRLVAGVAFLCLQCGLFARLRLICMNIVCEQKEFPLLTLSIIGQIWPEVFSADPVSTSDLKRGHSHHLHLQLQGSVFRFVTQQAFLHWESVQGEDEGQASAEEATERRRQWKVLVGQTRSRGDTSARDLAKGLLQTLQATNSANLGQRRVEMETLTMLTLLSRVQGWEWVYNCLICGLVWTAMANACTPRVLAKLINVIGFLGHLSLNEHAQSHHMIAAIKLSFEQLNKTLSVFLTASLSSAETTNENSDRRTFGLIVQAAAASALCRLGQNKETREVVSEWYRALSPEKRAKLSRLENGGTIR